jgi:hypothetical protein
VNDERKQLCGGLQVALFNGGQDAGDLAHGLEHIRHSQQLPPPSAAT